MPTETWAVDILVETLAEVTPAMIEAGSRALTEASVVRIATPGGRSTLMPRNTSEAQRLSSVWTAMLGAKLAGR